MQGFILWIFSHEEVTSVRMCARLTPNSRSCHERGVTFRRTQLIPLETVVSGSGSTVSSQGLHHSGYDERQSKVLAENEVCNLFLFQTEDIFALVSKWKSNKDVVVIGTSALVNRVNTSAMIQSELH